MKFGYGQSPTTQLATEEARSVDSAGAGTFALLSRRGFLQLSAVAGVALSLRRSAWAEGVPGAPVPLPVYRGWEDVYRERWRWDRIVCGTHTNANCVAACAWNLYVRDGVVWR